VGRITLVEFDGWLDATSDLKNKFGHTKLTDTEVCILGTTLSLMLHHNHISANRIKIEGFCLLGYNDIWSNES
jgi:hypothetical protein